MQMHEATITVEYVNEPDKNPDFGSVRAGGRYYGVPKNMLSQFNKGQTYTVGYTETEGKTGKIFYNLKEIRSAAAATASPPTGHNNPPNGNGADKDKKISALALYNHSFPIWAARSEGELDRAAMGDFLLECMLAVDWAETKYKKFWAEKNAPKLAPKPQQVVDDIGDTWAP